MTWVDRLQTELRARLIPQMSVNVTNLDDKMASVEVRYDDRRSLTMDCEAQTESPPVQAWVRQVASYYKRHFGLEVLRETLSG